MNGDYYGLPTTIITNQHLTLEFLSQAGPRLVRLFLGESRLNLLKEQPGLALTTPYGDYHFIGGHRLWHAPEAMPRSYIPDDAGLKVEQIQQGVRVSGPVEGPTSIQKSIEICLHPNRPGLTLTHILQNQGIWPVELAPWAITQFPTGGLAVLPQTTTPLDADGLLPNRQLVLWPYTSWEDDRLEPHDDYIFIRAVPKSPPVKLGYANMAGWIGYLNQEVFFYKKATYAQGCTYPDFGSSAECYCNDAFIELETLGPLTRLQPGQSVEHVETWELFPAPGVPVERSPVTEFIDSLHLL